MSLRKEPVFRRTIVPWYDANGICLLLAIFCAVVWGYSLIGIGVAISEVTFQRHIWVPALLWILSGVALVSVVPRLFKRYLSR